MVVRKRRRVWWVGVLVEEELCEKVDDVRRVNDRVLSLAIVPEGEVVRVVCAYAP